MIDQYATGYLMPALSFLLSCFGCGVGLAAISRAHIANSRVRVVWLALGAFAIGGAGAWAMHLTGLLGVMVEGARIRYDAASLVVAGVVGFAATAVGLFVADRAQRRLVPLLAGGLVAGLGVAAMFHIAMGAMQFGLGVKIELAPGLVVLSVLLSVVSAIAAVWFATTVRTVGAGAGAMLVMAAGLSGVQHLVMAAMTMNRVGTGPIPPSTRGLPPEEIILPIAIGVSALTLVLMIVLMALPSPRELAAQAKFEEWRERNRAIAQQQPAAHSKLL